MEKKNIRKVKIRLGTWYTIHINSKEQEIVEDMLNNNLEIIGLTDTKNKGRGMTRIHKEYWLFWSGMELKKEQQKE